jgi:nitronate monooxygenase
MLTTRLTIALGISHPIIQAPMALAAGGKLASAVTEAGGLGLIGGGYGQAEWLEQEFYAAGNSPVGCGFITWSLAKQPELLDQALSHDPKAMMLSFGDIAPFAPSIKAKGIPLIAQVQTLADAQQAMDHGADIIIAQGAEAGGHGLRRATMTLVPEIADMIAKDYPEVLLCAAGGIADGRGLVAALALGADGVLMGTRLWASEEASVHPNMHQSALNASGDDTIRSTVMDMARQRDWPQGFTARVLNNPFTEEWHGREDELAKTLDAIIPQYQQAWEDGDTNLANVFVGEATGLITRIKPAKDIIDTIIAEAKTIIQKQQDYTR